MENDAEPNPYEPPEESGSASPRTTGSTIVLAICMIPAVLIAFGATCTGTTMVFAPIFGVGGFLMGIIASVVAAWFTGSAFVQAMNRARKQIDQDEPE